MSAGCAALLGDCRVRTATRKQSRTSVDGVTAYVTTTGTRRLPIPERRSGTITGGGAAEASGPSGGMCTTLLHSVGCGSVTWKTTCYPQPGH